MTDPRLPAPGEIRVVLLLDETTFIGWAPGSTIDALMDSFERRYAMPVERRLDQIAQMQLRVDIAQKLRQNGCEAAWTDRLCAGCLWLALRHYSHSQRLRDAIDGLIPVGVVLTISVSPHAGSYPDTAWAFMVGTCIQDGRQHLAGMPPNEVRTIEGQALGL